MNEGTGPEFWLIAGPNGAGKTTLVQAEPISLLLPHVPFINPDDIALEILKADGWNGFHDASEPAQFAAFVEAANRSFAAVEERLKSRQPVGIETVLSTEKYLPLVNYVLQEKGFVGLIYIWVNSSKLASERVQQRTQKGGHDVDARKVKKRWERSLRNLGIFVAKASAFWIFDNSNSDPDKEPLLLARGTNGKLVFQDSDAPRPIKNALSALR